ncbi:MAG: TlpA disulfide reductase family protein [Bacteroidales bacterium]
MKRHYYIWLLLFLSVVLMEACNHSPKTCTVSGRLIGRKTDTIFVIKSGANPDIAEVVVPIKNNTFKFTLPRTNIEAYAIIFSEEYKTGGWHYVTFFNDRRIITCQLYPFEKTKENQIIGGSLNRELARFNQIIENKFGPAINPISDSIHLLSKEEKFWNKAVDTIFSEMDTTKNKARRDTLLARYYEMKRTGMVFTPVGRVLQAKLDSLYKQQEQFSFDYCAKNISLVSFNFLLNEFKDASVSNKSTASIQPLLPLLIKKYPDHPYSKTATDLMEGEKKIRVGGQFIDFTLPDLKGNEHKLSDLIRGQVALIDLWATWCGPCIRTSRSMIPVYQEFKDSGFIIVGVAGEIENTDQLVKHLEKEKYPWINLVEIDYKHGIWDKYNISNSAGMTVLVDQEGRILSINTDAEAVRAKLIEMLGTPKD